MSKQQQLVIVGLCDRKPLTGDRYMLGQDETVGQTVTMLEPVTPDNLLATDPDVAYGSVRVRLVDGTERVVSTLDLGVLVVPVAE